jgi:hypothetical protein
MRCRHILFFLFGIFFNKITYGSGFGGAISAGSGLSGRAVAEEGEGASFNPALVAFSKGYHFRITGLQPAGTTSQSALRVSILDSLPETVIPASILYSELKNHQNFTERDFLVNFGNMMGAKSGLGFGIGYRTKPHLDLSNPVQEERSQVYALVGAQHYFSNELSVAATFEPQNYGFGLGYIFRRLIRLRADYTQSSLGEAPGREGFISLGGETFINRWIVFRLGAIQASHDNPQSTWGVGFMGPRLKLNYAYAPFNILRSNEYAHWLDLSLPVW